MSREQHYLLPLEAIVETMQELPHMVSLQAQFSSLPTITREPCIADLVIGRGTLYSCTITTRAGRLLLQQQKAYTFLQQLGDLEWHVRPIVPLQEGSPALERPFPRQMSPPAFNGTFIPVRSVSSLSPVQMRTLTQMHKHVFALADGTKTVGYIARLLAKPPQEIQRILHDLQEMNLLKL